MTFGKAILKSFVIMFHWRTFLLWVDFSTNPTQAVTGCRFTIKPSSTSTVTLVATGSPAIGCASQTGSTVWGSYSIKAAGSTAIAHTMQVNCVQIAQSGTASTGVTLAVTITADSGAVKNVITMVTAVASALFLFF